MSKKYVVHFPINGQSVPFRTRDEALAYVDRCRQKFPNIEYEILDPSDVG